MPEQPSSSAELGDQPQHFQIIPTHPTLIGYVFWGLGFFGLHRFYFGKPLTGILWFFTLGIFFVGWIVDLFSIPQMSEEARERFPQTSKDYTVAWLLFLFLGYLGIHRFYLGKIVTGVIYLFTGGLLGFGLIYDLCTLNDQVAQTDIRPYLA